MNILHYTGKGALSALRSWKGIILSWLITFLFISIVAFPARSGFKSMLGDSMVTELLRDTINFDVITDHLSAFGNLFSALRTGFILLIFLGFFINAFITGGLFAILSNTVKSKSAGSFFAGAGSNFWSVTVITLIMSVIFSVVSVIIFAAPFIAGSGGDQGGLFPAVDRNLMRISFIVIVFILPVVLLVSDYARAWQVIRPEKKPFSAIGFGFGITFRTLRSSYPMMFILVLVQALFVWFTASKLLYAKPSTGWSVFLFFVLSQLVFIFRLWLRAWRYGSVTAAMEAFIEMNVNPVPEPVYYAEHNTSEQENKVTDLS